MRANCSNNQPEGTSNVEQERGIYCRYNSWIMVGQSFGILYSFQSYDVSFSWLKSLYGNQGHLRSENSNMTSTPIISLEPTLKSRYCGVLENVFYLFAWKNKKTVCLFNSQR